MDRDGPYVPRDGPAPWQKSGSSCRKREEKTLRWKCKKKKTQKAGTLVVEYYRLGKQSKGLGVEEEEEEVKSTHRREEEEEEELLLLLSDTSDISLGDGSDSTSVH